MKNVFLLFFCLVTLHALSQTEMSFTSHDFGELEEYSDRFIDLRITNKGVKKQYMLSVKKPAEVVYLVHGQFMEKDSSIVVRFQVNPKEKGRFTYEIEVFTSDRNEPTKIKLKGNLNYSPRLAGNNFQNCPTFGERSSGQNPLDFQLTVVTIDKETKEPLNKSVVNFLQNGRSIGAFKTNKSGKIVREIPLGYTYFYGSHEGYFPVELGTYVNFKRNYVVLELERDVQINIPPLIEDVVASIPDEIEEDSEVSVPVEITLEEQLNEVPVSETAIQVEEVPVSFADLDPNDFSEKNFKPINVVFVLDVSTSMNQGDRIELMKYTLFEMVKMLRPIDKISLVTYSTQAQVLLSMANGTQKELANKRVEELKASGFTAGGEGIKLGYAQNKKGFIEDGVNQVIIVTDGAFNRSSDDYLRYVKRFEKQGIKLSVIGIKNAEKDEEKMKEAALNGGGQYIPINKLADAQNSLKQVIRLMSYKF